MISLAETSSSSVGVRRALGLGSRIRFLEVRDGEEPAVLAERSNSFTGRLRTLWRKTQLVEFYRYATRTNVGRRSLALVALGEALSVLSWAIVGANTLGTGSLFDATNIAAGSLWLIGNSAWLLAGREVVNARREFRTVRASALDAAHERWQSEHLSIDESYQYYQGLLGEVPPLPRDLFVEGIAGRARISQ